MEKRIAIYLRVSTTGQNTELQRREIESYLQARGWSNWVIYEDKLTGTNTFRPNFRKLMSDAYERKFDLVVCWKICRIARSLKDLIGTLQELQDRGISFISLKDQIDLTTASGRLLTHLLGAFAEFEASLIKERVVAGLSNAKKKGIKLGRPRTIDESEVWHLRLQGLSLSQIAKRLNITKSAVSKTLKRRAVQVHENSCASTPILPGEKTEVSDTGLKSISVKRV